MGRGQAPGRFTDERADTGFVPRRIIIGRYAEDIAVSLHYSRRRLLGGIAAGALVGTAGCLRRAQDVATSVDAPRTGGPTYRRWLPTPDALPGDEDVYDAHYLRTSDLRGDETTVQAGVGLRNLHARTGRDPLGIDEERIEAVVKVDLTRATVLLGEFDTRSVMNGATEAGYERVDTDGDFTIHRRPDYDRVIAVSDEAVVHSHDEANPRAVVDAMLGARRGDVDRYHEADSEFEALTSTVGAPTLVWLIAESGMDSIADVTATTSTLQFDGDRVVYGIYYLFEDAESASAAAVREEIARGNLPRTAPLDITTDGRTVLVEYAQGIDVLAGDDYELRPLIAWNFDYDDAGGLTITHRAGDGADAEALTIEDASSSPLDTQFADEYDSVGPGDSLTVSVGPGTNVRIMWQGGDYGSRVGHYRIEQAEERDSANS